MGRYVLRRLLATLPVLLLVSLLTFALLWLVPGDPASMFLDTSATQEALDRVRREMGLDQPFLVRMGDWYWRVLQGDLGTSLLLNRGVTEAILERLPVTLSLTAIAFVFAVLIGVAAGVLAAVRHGRAADQGHRGGRWLAGGWHGASGRRDPRRGREAVLLRPAHGIRQGSHNRRVRGGRGQVRADPLA